MKTFFIISVVCFFIWIVLKIYKDIQNKIRNKITNQKQVQTFSVAKPLIIKKNSWLYPDDEFGRMEKWQFDNFSWSIEQWKNNT